MRRPGHLPGSVIRAQRFGVSVLSLLVSSGSGEPESRAEAYGPAIPGITSIHGDEKRQTAQTGQARPRR